MIYQVLWHQMIKILKLALIKKAFSSAVNLGEDYIKEEEPLVTSSLKLSLVRL
jgi:hypothetical protein